MGRRVHAEFGCRLSFKDGEYWVTCPVMLSHDKLGFSIGGSGKSVCSICGEDTFACSHVSGRLYDGVPAKHAYGICNICGEQKGCSHKEGEIYNAVRAISIVVDLRLDHVALVDNPANPLAVVHAHTLAESDILKWLSEAERIRFVHGKTVVHCHHCSMCSGID